jgi:hypothetical protein
MTWLRKRGYMKDDDRASNEAKEPSFAERLAELNTRRGTLENVKDDTGECEGRAEPSGPIRNDAVTRHGFNLHASPSPRATTSAGRRCAATACARLSRCRASACFRDGRISYRVTKSVRRSSRCRIMTPVECIARLCALVPPPRYPQTRFHDVLAPRAKLRPRVVPKLPPPSNAASACASPHATRKATTSHPTDRPKERPWPRDRDDDVVPAALPVAATTLASTLVGAGVLAPNVLSARHMDRIAGGLLYAASSNVPWATLLARTFDVDIKSCARCAGRLEVRAVVIDPLVARKILDAMRAAARAAYAPPTSSASAPVRQRMR